MKNNNVTSSQNTSERKFTSKDDRSGPVRVN